MSLIIYKRAGLVTYSAPMAQSDFSSDSVNMLTEASFYKILSGYNTDYSPNKIIKSGKAGGVLWGGNLSTIVSLCGLDVIPDEKFIFFVEDIIKCLHNC